jgi:hypothetical protein
MPQMHFVSDGDEEHHFYGIIDESYAIYDAILRRRSLQIHEYAEVAFKEYRSADLLSQFLEDEGFTVERGIAGRPTAFVGTWSQGKGPIVSFNAVRISCNFSLMLGIRCTSRHWTCLWTQFDRHCVRGGSSCDQGLAARGPSARWNCQNVWDASRCPQFPN